jgi:SNF2 family DNA or RNA helicase
MHCGASTKSGIISSSLVLQKLDRVEELNRETRKWLIQRKKTLIADQLPKKLDQVVFCELSAVQMRAYK